MDQRKVNMLAREYCDSAKIKFKPVILSHRESLRRPLFVVVWRARAPADEDNKTVLNTRVRQQLRKKNLLLILKHLRQRAGGVGGGLQRGCNNQGRLLSFFPRPLPTPQTCSRASRRARRR